MKEIEAGVVFNYKTTSTHDILVGIFNLKILVIIPHWQAIPNTLSLMRCTSTSSASVQS